MKHLKYLRYVCVHKWFVMLACFRYGLYWQGIVHDWSKFLPSEWIPYANFFYGAPPKPEHNDYPTILSTLAKANWERARDDNARKWRPRFDVAWLHHQHRSPHHWQHWVLREDCGDTKVLDMPMRYAKEMIADWHGAGRAITGKPGGTLGWYEKNRDKIQLSWYTRAFVDRELGWTPF